MEKHNTSEWSGQYRLYSMAFETPNFRAEVPHVLDRVIEFGGRIAVCIVVFAGAKTKDSVCCPVGEVIFKRLSPIKASSIGSICFGKVTKEGNSLKIGNFYPRSDPLLVSDSAQRSALNPDISR